MSPKEILERPVFKTNPELKVSESTPEVCSSANGILAKTRCRLDRFFTTDAARKSGATLKQQLNPEKAPKELLEAWQAQKDIAKHKEKKADDDVISLVQAPDGSRHYVSFKQSFKERNKVISVSVAGNHLQLTSELTNGYNTEYIITDKRGKAWKMLAILYTTTNPDYRQQLRVIQEFQGEFKEAEVEEANLKNELNYIHKKLIELDKKTHKQKEKPELKGSKKPKEKQTKKSKNEGKQTQGSKSEEKQSLKEKEKGKLKVDLNSRAASIEKKLIPKMIASKAALLTSIDENTKKLSGIVPKINFTYSPYARIFEKPETIDVGFNYLNTAVNKAWGMPELGVLNSKLGKSNNLSIPTAVIPEIAIALNIVERMSYQEYFETVSKEKEVCSKDKK